MQVWAGCRTQAILSRLPVPVAAARKRHLLRGGRDISQLFTSCARQSAAQTSPIKTDEECGEKPALRVLMQGVRPLLDISHDVPVRVLSELEVRHISAPLLESEMVQIVLPCLAELSKFVDKVRLHLVRSHDVHSEGQRAGGWRCCHQLHSGGSGRMFPCQLCSEVQLRAKVRARG
ncbi:putative Checkpoint protein HUS1 [Trypanosoma cruzi]|uniref:Putative Checkpoint protein HUS1 n=1 Tax=Trypanosoma cruzi TaxID=5693 RepID=A0A2V2VE65_TRYCR|nr:putative Checkpoint protein HUS1 [Trypanosoma cruzi]